MSPAFTLRPYRPADAATLSGLYARSVRALGAQHYLPEQVEAWASLAPGAAALDARMADGRTRLVASDPADTPLGFLDLEANGHIDLLYVDPRVARSGVGRALLEAAIGHGHPRLHAEASETARPLFERAGFVVTARRDFKVAGVPIHNWAVERLAGPQAPAPPGKA